MSYVVFFVFFIFRFSYSGIVAFVLWLNGVGPWYGYHAHACRGVFRYTRCVWVALVFMVCGSFDISESCQANVAFMTNSNSYFLFV